MIDLLSQTNRLFYNATCNNNDDTHKRTVSLATLDHFDLLKVLLLDPLLLHSWVTLLWTLLDGIPCPTFSPVLTLIVLLSQLQH
jgi:hypothetical protein